MPEGSLGSALAMGDYNGDRLDDLAMGAPLVDLTFKDQGTVYLVLGSAELKGSLSAPQAASLQLNGRDVGDDFGHALAFGDLNGDMRADLIVGAPGGDGPTNLRPAAGEVLVYFGMSVPEVRPAGLIIYGPASNPGSLGASLAVGDFTGDGIVDLAMGAPSLAVVGLPLPFGAVYLILGSRQGLVP